MIRMNKMECESMPDFVLLTGTFNEKFFARQSLQKEIVSDDEAVKALTYIEWLDISRIEDCFLFCAAFNLCNTYVKQSDYVSTIGEILKAKGIDLSESVSE